MISVVICSRETYIRDSLQENISVTIGCDYELIVIDNSRSNFSIFEAYNIGLDKSKNEIVCFIHEDLLFKSDHWGKHIEEIFMRNPEAGLIGIAGAKVKSLSPSPWWGSDKKYHVQNIIQHTPNKSITKLHYGFNDQALVQVVVVDGVFFALKRDPQIRFNENFSGFHNYDLNISIEYWLRKYKAFVTQDILIEHFSSGKLDESWLKSTAKIHDFYKNVLPISVINDILERKSDQENFENFIYRCFKEKQLKLGLKYGVELILRFPLHAKYGLLFKYLFQGLMSK